MSVSKIKEALLSQFPFQTVFFFFLVVVPQPVQVLSYIHLHPTESHKVQSQNCRKR